MPLSKHYGGHGEKVAASMKEQYGDRWKEVFYATENARKKHRYTRMISRAKKGK
jgi:hypothetical protein